MFENRTFETILAEMLALAPADIDTRQGSVFYDACAPAAFEIAEMYRDLEATIELSRATTATGEYLDEKAKEYGLARDVAVAARRAVTIAGTTPAIGDRFFDATTGLFFALANDATYGGLHLVAELAGAASNSVPPSTALLPVNDLLGLESVTIGAALLPGADAQSDESLQGAIAAKVAKPTENGNRYHYKKWCEDISGVGRARIFPLWNGICTVKAVLIGTDGQPATTGVVSAVQAYIDPNANGDGEGVANIGAVFTAVAATPLAIAAAFTATPKTGKTAADVKAEFEPAFEALLLALAMDTPEGDDVILRYNSVGSLILGLPSALDYTGLTLNSGSANILVGDGEVAVKGVVTVA